MHHSEPHKVHKWAKKAIAPKASVPWLRGLYIVLRSRIETTSAQIIVDKQFMSSGLLKTGTLQERGE